MINLSEIKARLAAATPGPWLADLGNWQVESQNDVSYRDGICSFTPNNRDRIDGTPNPVDPMDDADFIANAPTDITALIEALEKCKEEMLSAAFCLNKNSAHKFEIEESLLAVVKEVFGE